MATATDNTIPGRMFDRVPVKQPVIVTPSPIMVAPPSSCSCQSAGSGFEQKIKENPLVFVLGALAIGYMLAKK